MTYLIAVVSNWVLMWTAMILMIITEIVIIIRAVIILKKEVYLKISKDLKLFLANRNRAEL